MLHPALIIPEEAAICVFVVDFDLGGCEFLDCFVGLLPFEGEKHLLDVVEDALELVQADEVFVSFSVDWEGLLYLVVLLDSRAHIVLASRILREVGLFLGRGELS